MQLLSYIGLKMWPSVKLLATCVLFKLFFWFFGLPSLEVYLRRDIQTVASSSPNPQGLPPPGVTVCAKGPTGGGWKNKEDCSLQTDFSKFEDCVKTESFRIEDVINATFLSNNGWTEKSPVKSSLWAPRLTQIARRSTVCFTLTYKLLLERKDQLVITFVKNLTNYIVYLHDADFFMLKSDTFFLPYLTEIKPTRDFYKLEATYKLRMNRPSKFECNTDKNYNFNQCISNNLVEKIGCKYLLSSSNISNYPSCTTNAQLEKYKDITTKSFFACQQELQDLTGCKVPCYYRHYQVVGTPSRVDMDGRPFMSLAFASTERTVVKEVWFYSFVSLLSEMGGALGLFLGFSFLGTLDLGVEYGAKLWQILKNLIEKQDKEDFK